MKNTNLTIFLILILISITLIFPELSFAQERTINIQGSITSLTSQVRIIGLSLLGASLCGGAVMMGFGNQLGTKIVTSAIMGAIILLASTSIIELVKGAMK